MVTFTYNGKEYTMPRETVRAAVELYRYENLLEDARIHLASHLFDDDNIPDENTEDYHLVDTEAQEKYHRTVEELFSESSLRALAARFEKRNDCNNAPNDTWDSVLKEYLKFLSECSPEGFDYDQFAGFFNTPVIVRDDGLEV